MAYGQTLRSLAIVRPVLDSWDKRVGSILMILREQEYKESRNDTAIRAGIDGKTAKTIELGGGGSRVEKYAGALGLSMDELSELALLLGTISERFARVEVKQPQPTAAAGERKRAKRKHRAAS